MPGEATGPAAHVLSPTSSCNGSIDDDIVDVGDGVELAPVHDDVRDDIICDIFNLPKSTIFYQDFSCALVSTIVYHGRMYPAGDQVCFYSNLFGKETKVLIPYDSIADVSKTSSMFSHGLRIQTTAQKEYSFSSFWGNNRDHCAAIIVALRQKSLGKSSSPFLSIAPQRAPPPPTQGAPPVSLPSPPSGPISSPSDRPVQASEANVSTAATSAPPALLLTPDEQQHPFTDVAHDTFSVSSDEFVKLFLSDTAIYGIDEANRRRGATDIVCSPWTSDQDGRGRRICCSPTKPSPIFSALADCHFHAARRCPDRAQELSCRCEAMPIPRQRHDHAHGHHHQTGRHSVRRLLQSRRSVRPNGIDAVIVRTRPPAARGVCQVDDVAQPDRVARQDGVQTKERRVDSFGESCHVPRGASPMAAWRRDQQRRRASAFPTQQKAQRGR
ncbi:hypothetical protein, variant 5 [Aphanomyces invadans]|uniref:GRAM domain-containing protein n=1 Tax=Aphanomyces invadans TaxID=157072 RepID=A0A024UIL2_9STRA|nr:hypothetical protein, variant 3 [Aphanomyces invadans]XP_008865798.1 hypothetical protein, variant 4 [Aphanomyces invadans]XP_008865799.1 hypothetical protein, variant 5 [Aphanomyces invadans]ETW06020.1 hypothetical protein, variant 3 [Aphanomyces invadans]ETW06021.1 hypothetical protein, variant 4 [Aphanomyces invadans]ETW06022.1 hypothetical protein, variant 5 [Aphanomyces invadans]|eukprot:XP_008865796.1 hypothetical protein, variant 3 [Aphanomyces invadans]